MRIKITLNRCGQLGLYSGALIFIMANLGIAKAQVAGAQKAKVQKAPAANKRGTKAKAPAQKPNTTAKPSIKPNKPVLPVPNPEILTNPFPPEVASPKSDDTPKQRISPIRLGAVTTYLPGKAPLMGAPLKIIKPVVGRWVYIARRSPDSVMCLVVHDIEEVAIENGKEKAVNEHLTLYPIHRAEDFAYAEFFKYHVLALPILSPDGKYVLFKFDNQGEMRANHVLFILDLDIEKKELKPATLMQPAYPEASWSSDGEYIAFMTGGDDTGRASFDLFGREEYMGPLELWVYRWRTNEVFSVTKDDSISGSFLWVAPHTLIFQAVVTVKDNEFRPSIFAFDAEKRQLKVLVENAVNPFPSPDGKSLAYFGPGQPNKPWPIRSPLDEPVNGDALTIANLDGSGRFPLTREYGAYSNIQWLSHGDKLITVQPLKGSLTKAAVKEWDLATRKFRLIADLTIKDQSPFPDVKSYNRFFPVQLTKDEKCLILKFFQMGVQRTKGIYDSMAGETHWLSINLGNGAVSEIAVSHPFTDWSDSISQNQ